MKAVIKAWITHCGLWFIRLICLLPMSWLLFLGRLIGWIAYFCARHRRHIVETNIRRCFPNLEKAAQQKLVMANFMASGMGIFETGCAWFKSSAAVASYIEIQGLENLEAAKQSGRGVLLTTIHFCALEFGARAIAERLPFYAMYRPHKNPVFEHFQFELRKKQSQRPPLARDQLRQTLKVLKKGEWVWYAPDQNYGGTDHVFVPFFNIPALTITATSKLAELTNALVLPYYVIRRDSRYYVKILPALNDFPSLSQTTDCMRLNTLFESWINEAPEQYLWAHRRFKTRPVGENPFY